MNAQLDVLKDETETTYTFIAYIFVPLVLVCMYIMVTVATASLIVFGCVKPISAGLRLRMVTADAISSTIITFVVLITFIVGLFFLVHGIQENREFPTSCNITNADLKQRVVEGKEQFKIDLEVSYRTREALVVTSTLNLHWKNGFFSPNDTKLFIGEQIRCFYFATNNARVALEDTGHSFRVIYSITLICGCIVFLCEVVWGLEVITKQSQDRIPLLPYRTPSTLPGT